MKRYMVLLIAAVVTAAVGVAGALARSERTTLHLYTPYGANGRIARGIRVAKTVRGYCWSTSNVDARSDAYRCYHGNYILDPCFSDFSGSQAHVLCPEGTPRSAVVRIRLTKRLPASQNVSDPTRHPPWVVQLASGQWCAAADGATSEIAGMGISYFCSRKAVLLGAIHRHSSRWTVFYARSPHSDAFETVSVRAAWW